MHRLQTGDVPEKRRSGQAAESQYGVVASQAGSLDFLPLGIVNNNIGKGVADSRPLFDKIFLTGLFSLLSPRFTGTYDDYQRDGKQSGKFHGLIFMLGK